MDRNREKTWGFQWTLCNIRESTKRCFIILCRIEFKNSIIIAIIIIAKLSSRFKYQIKRFLKHEQNDQSLMNTFIWLQNRCIKKWFSLYFLTNINPLPPPSGCFFKPIPVMLEDPWRVGYRLKVNFHHPLYFLMRKGEGGVGFHLSTINIRHWKEEKK